jgi:hypothetical protein
MCRPEGLCQNTFGRIRFDPKTAPPGLQGTAGLGVMDLIGADGDPPPAQPRVGQLRVADQDQPFGYPKHVPGEYLVEGVSAVGEIKSKLTIAELRKSVELLTKLRSGFRRLPDIQTTFPQDRRPHQSGVHHQGSTRPDQRYGGAVT